MVRQHAVRAIGLFGFLMALYFCTYSAHPISGDEQIMFDGASSFYRVGSLELAYFNNDRPYFPMPLSHPVLSMDVEPLQSYIAAALIGLAAHLPEIGSVQAAWTLNLWVTALTAVVLYDTGVILGYRDRTALIVALLYGTATMAWPYSGLFFREPLFTLLALTCADCLLRWRKSQHRYRLIWIGTAGVVFAGALLTKGVALLLVPGLIILIMPRLTRRFVVRSLSAGLAVPAFAGGIFLIYQHIAPGVRYRFASIWAAHIDLSHLSMALSTALSAWLLSPGFSLWVFSPVLLIALVGAYRLWTERRFREFLLPLIVSLTFLIGYPILQGWFSGLGWGPRYLLPLIPFLMLWTLPIIEAVNWRTHRAATALIGIVVLVSIAIQLLAVYVPVETFGTVLSTLSQQNPAQPILPWQEGVWNWRYSPLVITFQALPHISPQIAWIVTHTGVVVLPFCFLTLGLSGLALGGRRKAALAVLVLIPLTVYVGLRQFYHDPRFGGDDPVLWQTLDRLQAEVRPGDAILLNDDAYRNFFANYYQGHVPIYVLPEAPNERTNPDDLTKTVLDNVDGQVHPYTWTLLSRLVRTTSRWWFVTEFTPFSQDRIRANEHFIARHFFPVQDVISTPTLRLVEFAPVPAPSPQSDPAHPLTIDFGAAQLIGFDLPHGDEFRAGDTLPISLLWKRDGWPSNLAPLDYGINVSLIDSQGFTVIQSASSADGSFGMVSWENGKHYRDNRAFTLPTTLPSGNYKLWISVYDWRDGHNLPVQNVDLAADHALIGTIIILT